MSKKRYATRSTFGQTKLILEGKGAGEQIAPTIYERKELEAASDKLLALIARDLMERAA